MRDGYVDFDEFKSRPIFKQEKRKWVAVLRFRSSHRPPTPTVKPFLRYYRVSYSGGLLSGVFR